MPDFADFAPRRFSIDSFTERDRLERWREEFGRAVVKVDIEPVERDAPFKADATLQSLPGIGIAFCEGSATRLNRSRQFAAADDGKSIGLIVNLGAPARVTQRGVERILDQGAAVLIRPEEPGVLEGTRHLNLVLPRSAISHRVGGLDALYMRSIPRENEALQLLVGYLRVMRADFALKNPALQQAVTTHIYDLVALATVASRDMRENVISAVSAARLAQLLDYLDRRFSDPSTTVASVARRHGISERYLQKLFERSGTSFTSRLTDLRLNKAFALLTERPARYPRISEIALAAGFSDISHFNRLFRARFGDTPTGVRET